MENSASQDVSLLVNANSLHEIKRVKTNHVVDQSLMTAHLPRTTFPGNLFSLARVAAASGCMTWAPDTFSGNSKNNVAAPVADENETQVQPFPPLYLPRSFPFL
jgi:hypothetical protein